MRLRCSCPDHRSFLWRYGIDPLDHPDETGTHVKKVDTPKVDPLDELRAILSDQEPWDMTTTARFFILIPTLLKRLDAAEAVVKALETYESAESLGIHDPLLAARLDRSIDKWRATLE